MSRPVGSRGRCASCGEYGHIARGGDCSAVARAEALVRSGASYAEASRLTGAPSSAISDRMARLGMGAALMQRLAKFSVEEHW